MFNLKKKNKTTKNCVKTFCVGRAIRRQSNTSNTERFLTLLAICGQCQQVFLSPPHPHEQTNKLVRIKITQELIFNSENSKKRYFSPHLCEDPPEVALWTGTGVPIFLLPPEGFLLPTGPRPMSHRNCSCLLQQILVYTKVD